MGFRYRLKGERLGMERTHKQQQGRVTLRSKSNQTREQPRSYTKSENNEHKNKLSNGEGVVAEATMFERIWYDTTKM